ncbi:MAG: hypothetical protein N2114_00410 [Candidatus Goldbacteria bacterium]|nr:hypothetical protein [Candidatus Goldiibacteriota bacterium]
MFISYPMFVKPIIKEKIWGGNFLKKFLTIKSKKNIGEVWFFADQKNESSIIKNGIYKGKKLSEIYKKFRKNMVGQKIAKKYKKNFPVLLKFIEAKENLSVQVHPDDKYALKNENSLGKSEVWYIINSSRNAGIFLGTKQKIKGKIFSGKQILKFLKKYKTKKYDCFFIPSGTLHTLLKGNVVLEIQQNSDVTYRVYDWDRLIQKKPRQLHLDKARAVIKFNKSAGKIKKQRYTSNKNYKINHLIKCRYFSIYETTIEKNYEKCYNIKKPSLLTVLYGNLKLFYKNKIYKLKAGDVVFLPINLLRVVIKTKEKSRFILTEIR